MTAALANEQSNKQNARITLLQYLSSKAKGKTSSSVKFHLIPGGEIRGETL
jgi:hypothetical protein